MNEQEQKERLANELHQNSPLGVGGMIFAAGLGTRFKPWTDKYPKALAEINGKSLLQRNIEYLQQYGITDVVVNVHHFSDQIINAVEQNNGWGSKIIISDERDEVLETGGGLLKAKHLLSRRPFITINVDILTDLNIHSLIEYHKQQHALITLCIAERKTSRFLLFDEKNHLCGWRNIKADGIIEKIVVYRKLLQQKAYSGIAFFEPEALDLIPFTGKFSLIDVYLALTTEHLVLGYDHSGDKWIDVGKPDSVALAESMFS
ncbi:MAG: NTP transferase domain-containing protein [Chitinophagaceae bacterium]|nr:NTP transferase domain-containing protein [Chitinophagaceae bacterium]